MILKSRKILSLLTPFKLANVTFPISELSELSEELIK